MDWDMFKDVSFLLMSAGKYIRHLASNHSQDLDMTRLHTNAKTEGFFSTFWGIYFSFYFIVAYAQSQLHLTSHASVTLLILMNATNLPGRLLPPLLSDRRFGPMNTIIPCIFLTSVFLFIWIGAKSHNAIIVVACFYGFFSGAVQGLYNPAIWNFPGDNDAKRGIRVAFVFMGIGFAALTGTPIGGALIKREDGGYLGAQLFAAVTVLVGGCLMIAARYAKVGWGIMKF